MKKVLPFAAAAEAATGLAFLVMPAVMARLLFSAELTGVAPAIARVGGIALIALGVACWPGRTALCGMLTYNALGALYFLFLAIRSEWTGPLLWPAVVAHAVIAILLGRAWLKNRSPQGPSNHASG
jgi:hypothetical protein